MAEVLIEGRRLDVMEGLDFSFNYSIADVRDPNKRSTNYSKTIKCPSTKNNDILFGHIYDVNISNPNNPSDVNIEVNFNPNKKAEARVIQDGVEVMTGVVQLRSITINNGRYDYEVVFIGNLKTIFSELGDKKLNGFEVVNGQREYYIDLSSYDHLLNASNQSASWSAPIGDGYVYPMVDLGKSFEFNSDGYRDYRVDDLRPAIYVKTLVDKIFDFSGFTYTSNFFNSNLFKSLCVLVDQPMLSPEVANTRTFRAVKKIDNFQSMHRISSVNPNTFGNEAVFFVTSGIMPKLCFEDDNLDGFDNNDQYKILSTPNNLTGQANNYTFVCQQSERNDIFRASVDLRLIKNHSIAQNFYQGTLEIVKEDTLGNIEVIGSTFWNWNLNDIPVGTSATQTIYVEGETTTTLNDQVYVRMDASGFPNTAGFNPDFISPTVLHPVKLAYVAERGYFENEPIIGEVYEGDTMKLSDHLPKAKMSEFLVSIFKMFNLYVTTQNDLDNNLIIETRDEFYGGGVSRDWTKKIARDKTITLKPLGLLTAGEYIYTYKDDGDYYNEKYKSSNDSVYGSRTIDLDNDFINKSQKVEVMFSPSPLVNDGATSRIIPAIYDADIDDGAKPTDINVRMLYYGGLLKSIPKWRHVSVDGTATEEDFYPYAGHWDNPIFPTLDINFGLPNEIYYSENPYTGQLQVTNANLFNVYHKRSFDEISDKDSKLMTANAYLDAWDIQKLDFRDQILIDNCYWRINKINDYNPFKEGLTKIELVKVKDIDGVDFEPETGVAGSNAVIGNSTPTEKTPVRKSLVKSNRNVYQPFNGSVFGKNNKVKPSANNFKILGDSNKIGEGCKNISIQGNNNIVADGLENIVLINTDNTTVTESNTIYQNGVNVTGGEVQSASLFIPSADVLQLNTTPLTIVPAQGTGKGIEVIGASVKVDFNTTPYATNIMITLITSGATEPQADNSIDASVTRIGKFRHRSTSGSLATATQVLANAPLQVSVATGNPTAGDSDIEVFVLYRVIDV